MSTKAPKRKRASVAVRDAAPVAAPVEVVDVDSQLSDTATLAVLEPEALETEVVAAAASEPAGAPPSPATDATAIMETVVVTEPISAEAVPQSATPMVALPSNSTVKDASVLKNELTKLLDVPAAVVIDVRSVERVDTATVQLLYAFVRDRAERNGMVEWLGSPPVLLDAIRLLGVQEVLALPAAGAE